MGSWLPATTGNRETKDCVGKERLTGMKCRLKDFQCDVIADRPGMNSRTDDS